MFLAFIGFDVVATAAEETRRPQRDMPIGIIASLSICTALYVAVSLVVTGMVKYTDIKVEAPLAEAFRSVGQPGYATVISVGAHFAYGARRSRLRTDPNYAHEAEEAFRAR